jgi:predicted metal-dependent phosphoesterase TrpH
MKYDLHTHSRYSSDGFLDPKKMVKTALKKGLSGIAITDHNTIKGGLKAKKYETKDFQVIVGSEITTERGEVIGLFLSEEIRSETFIDIVNEIRAQNGVVVIPHPFDGVRSTAVHPDKKDIKFIDHLEVFNSRCILHSYNEEAAKFASAHGLKTIAGSDCHFLNELGKAGIITGPDDILEAVLKGDFEIFGEKSWPVNLGLTWLLKIWRRQVF